MEQQFDALIEKHEKLQRLLKENELGTLTEFKEEEFQNEDFKTYIQADYCKSILTICHKYLGSEKEGKVIAAMRSVQHLANQNAKEVLLKDLFPLMDESIQVITDVYNAINDGRDDTEIEKIAGRMDKTMSNGMMSIFNTFYDQALATEKKEEMIRISLDICDLVVNVKPTRETFKYALHNVIINNLDKIKNYGMQEERFRVHAEKIDRKRKGVDNKYYIWIAVILILFIGRMCARMT